ncbi:MAG: hypothetical protein ACOC41_08685 [Chitinivibrionales bacterium]
MGRWYDSNKKLACCLESLRCLESGKRERIVRDLIELIRSEEPAVLEDFVLEFPLDVYRRRWYDKDPYLWIIFNGMRFASESLVNRVIHYFDINRTAPATVQSR